MIRAAIIDDEIKSILILKKLLEAHCPEVEVIIEATNMERACAMIRENEPQLVFLDIEMSEGTGFDLLRAFDAPSFHVIFVTAHSNYAVKAFKVSAIDFIVKPIDVDDLVSAVRKAAAIIKKDTTTGHVPLHFFNIRTRRGFLYIKPENITRIEAENSYCRVFVNDGQQHLLSHHLGAIEESLDKEMFLRIHKSDIININYLKNFHQADGLFVEMMDGSMVKVARRCKKRLEAKLNQPHHKK
jgi:two-component system LytT family response regulator